MYLERVLRQRRRVPAILSIVLCGWALMMWMERRAPAEAAHEPAPAPAHASQAESGPLIDDPTDLRRQQVTASLYMLFVIIGVGVAMLLWIVWWGFRVRRRLLEPLPPAPRGDELWYLKRPVESRPPTTEAHPKPEPPPDDVPKPNGDPDPP